jgi:hypothetical protein
MMPQIRGRDEWLAALAEKREQWAACWTYKCLTYGLHSTQRIEAVHSAVQQYCKKSMLVTKLREELDRHAESAGSRSETTAIRNALKNSNRDHAFHPRVTDLQWIVSPHAYSLLLAQAAQTEKYDATVKPTPLGDASATPDLNTVFVVKRAQPRSARPPVGPAPLCIPCAPATTTVLEAATAPDTAPETADELRGATPTGVLETEYGLSSTDGDRETSLVKCSCQYYSSWGIMCRHQLKVASMLGVSQLPDDAVASFWKKEVPPAATDQSASAGAGVATSARSTSTAETVTTSEQRADQLQIEFRNAASIACLQVGWSEVLLNAVRMWICHFRTEATSAFASSATAPSAPPAAAADGAQVGAATAPAPAPIMFANAAHASGAAGRRGARLTPADPTAPTSKKRARQ